MRGGGPGVTVELRLQSAQSFFLQFAGGSTTLVPPTQSTGGSSTQKSLSGEVSKSTGPVVTGNILFDEQVA